MTNVITFTQTPDAQENYRVQRKQNNDNVVIFEDWRNAPHPVRTPTGVFFVTNVWNTDGDAA